MKTFRKMKIVSLIIVFLIIFNLIPFGAFTSKVYSTTPINEIRLTSSTTSVDPGTLPQFSVATTTEHVTEIDDYGSNSNWMWWGKSTDSWQGFGTETPTAVDDGKTHYALSVCVNLESGYSFDNNTKIYFNGADITSLGHSMINIMSWGGYVYVDLGTAGTELPKYTVSFDSNGGTGTKNPITVYQGETVDLGPNTFTPPTGMSFKAWKIGDVEYAINSDYTPTGDTVVKAVWTNKYIRESRATMTPATISSNISANDLVFTSMEPSKYNVALWRVFDKTDSSLNTDNGKYPVNSKFVAGHLYAIEFEFSEAGDYYEYDQITNTSKFYLNNGETDISAAVAISGSTQRRIELTATNGNTPVTHTVTFELNGGNMPGDNPVIVDDGIALPQPNPGPTKDGCTFAGWYADSLCNIPFDFGTPITTDNVHVYAKWDEQKITLQLDSATVSGNVITFSVDNIDITATVSGTGYSFNGNNLIINMTNINDVKLTLSNNFDKSQMHVQFHDGQILAVNDDNEVVFGGLNYENDNAPHLQILFNGGGQQGGPVGGPEDISFDLTWNDTYVIVNINDKEVLGDSDVFQDTYTFNNIVIEKAGETDVNKTNIIRLQNRFGDKEVSEFTINNVKYDKNSNNVEINEFGWLITVPGAEKYVISGTGDSSIPTPKTIIWVNPDYVPENEEDAQWVSGFTISHGTAKIVEVYDENGILLDPDQYTSKDADEYGLDNGFGWVSIMPGSRVVFEFVPEYGYQLTGIAINETPLEAINDMNRFEIELPNAEAGNLHFAATFTKTEDVVKADSEKVKSGGITLGSELESGSVQLTVKDVELSSDKIKGFENAAGDYTISNYLDIDLYNIFYKGKNDSEDVWSNKIDELEKEATITLKLADGITADDIVLVHNVHDGDTYEIIPIESYDPATNTITFKAKSFSNYAIATKTTSTTENNTNNETTNTTTEKTTTTKEGTTTSSSPKTGDNITMWIGLMLVSILGVFGAYKYLKKRV